MKRTFLSAVTCLFVALTIVAGCTPKRPPLNPQTQAKIQQDQQQSAVAMATEQETARLSQLQGQDNPILHPIKATNNLVVELRPWLIWITIISALLWAIEFGLSFTSFSFLSFLNPVFRWVAILSLTALITLPFLPLSIFAVGLALVGLVTYELVKDKGNVTQAVKDAEDLLGVYGHIGTGTISSGQATLTTKTATVTSTLDVSQLPPAPATAA